MPEENFFPRVEDTAGTPDPVPQPEPVSEPAPLDLSHMEMEPSVSEPQAPEPMPVVDTSALHPDLAPEIESTPQPDTGRVLPTDASELPTAPPIPSLPAPARRPWSKFLLHCGISALALPMRGVIAPVLFIFKRPITSAALVATLTAGSMMTYDSYVPKGVDGPVTVFAPVQSFYNLKKSYDEQRFVNEAEKPFKNMDDEAVKPGAHSDQIAQLQASTAAGHKAALAIKAKGGAEKWLPGEVQYLKSLHQKGSLQPYLEQMLERRYEASLLARFTTQRVANDVAGRQSLDPSTAEKQKIYDALNTVDYYNAVYRIGIQIEVDAFQKAHPNPGNNPARADFMTQYMPFYGLMGERVSSYATAHKENNELAYLRVSLSDSNWGDLTPKDLKFQVSKDSNAYVYWRSFNPRLDMVPSDAGNTDRRVVHTIIPPLPY